MYYMGKFTDPVVPTDFATSGMALASVRNGIIRAGIAQGLITGASTRGNTHVYFVPATGKWMAESTAQRLMQSQLIPAGKGYMRSGPNTYANCKGEIIQINPDGTMQQAIDTKHVANTFGGVPTYGGYIPKCGMYSGMDYATYSAQTDTSGGGGD